MRKSKNISVVNKLKRLSLNLVGKRRGYFGNIDVAKLEVFQAHTSLTLNGWTFHPERKFSKFKIVVEGHQSEAFEFSPRTDVLNVFNFKNSLQSGFSIQWVLPPLHTYSPNITIVLINAKGKIEDHIDISQKIRISQPPPLNTINESDFERIKKSLVCSDLESLHAFLNYGEPIQFKNSSSPVLSILIVTHNRPELILKCLRSLVSLQQVEHEIIVVDNASDNLTQQLFNHVEGIRFYKNTENLHFLRAANYAAQQARGKYLLFLNSDCFVNLGAIESCLRLISSNKKIGAVGPRVLNIDGTVQEAGSIIWKDGFTAPYGSGRPADSAEISFLREVDYVSGAFLMTPSKLFLELEGFDESYLPAYYEDTDYCVKLHKKNYLVVYNPNAIVTHFQNASAANIQEVNTLISDNQKIFLAQHSDFLSTRSDFKTANLFKSRFFDSSKKSILVIDNKIPNPTSGAGFPRSNFIINSMIQLGYHVTLFAAYPDGKVSHKLANIDPKVEIIDSLGMNQLPNFLVQRQGSFDKIWVSRPECIEHFSDLIKTTGLPISSKDLIFDSEALVTFRQITQLSIHGKTPTVASVKKLDRELALYSLANRVIAVSNLDAQCFAKAGKNVSILGHFHPYNNTARKFTATEGFLFIGPLTDFNSPNFDSMDWFVNKVWPILLKEHPKAKLYCVGKINSKIQTVLGRSGIHFLGEQKDLSTFYKTSRVFIAPTRFAAGIPYKCTEAASFGIPQVITPILAQQLQWRHQEQALVAKNPEDFAQQCLRLHSDEKLWKTLNHQSSHFAKIHYNVDAGASQLREILGN